MNDTQKYYTRLQLIIDIAVLIASFMLAWFIKFRTNLLGESARVLSLGNYLVVLAFIIPVFLILYYVCNLYPESNVRGRKAEAANLIKANTIGILIIIVALYVVKQVHVSRTMLVAFYVIDLLLDGAVRNAIRNIRLRNIREGRNIKRILLVGYSNSAEEYIKRTKAYPELGYRIVGILDDSVEPGTEFSGVKVLGRISSIMELLPENSLDEIAITLELSEYYRLEQIVSVCEKSGVHTKFIPDYYNIVPTRPYTEDLMGLPIINIRYVPLNNTFQAGIKRFGDIIGSLLLIALFSPVMLICVIGIKTTMPGPLIFKQKRIGLHNREFEMLKFRSMVVQKESEEKKAWTTKDDPRVTKFGKFMRRTSLDEVPQFFNVLRGDMSLVGPRPERPYFVEKFKEEIPRYMIKHQVRPGVTGWAQVNGYRGDTSITKRIDYDLYYIENWTVSFDFKILFMTVFKGFRNKNAY